MINSLFSSIRNTFSSQKCVSPQDLHFASAEIDKPVHLHVAITYDCKAACPHCYMLQQNKKAFKDKLHMDVSLYKRILASSHAKSAKKITLTGGEPLLHPAFFDWLKMAHEAGIPKIASITNGISMQDDDLVQKLISCDVLDAFNVSLDSDNKAGFCRAKAIKDADFESICSNIKALTKRFKDTKTRISGSFVIMTLDAEKARRIIQFSEDLGLHKVTLHALHVAKKGSVKEGGAVVGDICAELMAHNDYKMDVTVKLPYPLCHGTFYCSSLATFLCVGADSSLAPCCHIPWDEKYGEYSETDANPMNHAAILSMRKAFIRAYESKNDNMLPEACKLCSKRSRGHLYFNSNQSRWYHGLEVGG